MVGNIRRLIKPIENKSFFLFGARGSGKTTYLKDHYSERSPLNFDLLDAAVLDELRLDPRRFKDQVLDPKHHGKTVIIDEVQKLPVLLDYVHQLIESHRIQFILTGSSARRLRQKGVNLLAGRAYVYELFPFTSYELGKSFDLMRVLERGALPQSYLAQSDEESSEYLRAYVLTYLEKEIQQEQWVRKLEPFRKFLQVASQMNGKLINRSRIARDVGVDDMTVESYFEILKDTLIGITVPGYHPSVRKQYRQGPKFYWIDPGIKRALDKTLRIPLARQSSVFGEAFEHWVFLELYKYASYLRLDWSFYYANTKDRAEIDLVIKRPGEPLLLIEIKSKDKVESSDAKTLVSLGEDLDAHATKLLLSCDPITHVWGAVRAMHWQNGLHEILKLPEPIS